MRRPGSPGRLSFWFRGSSGLRHCRLTPLHLLYRDLFDVGCQPPLVAEAVPNPRAAVSVELVLGSRRDSPPAPSARSYAASTSSTYRCVEERVASNSAEGSA